MNAVSPASYRNDERSRVKRPTSGCALGVALLLGTSTLLGAGCTAVDDDYDVEADEAAIAQSGAWRVPQNVLSIGDQQLVEYVGAGPWRGPSGCGGGFRSGSAALGAHLMRVFPRVYTIGGYACRHIVGDPDNMSVHATGRAIDVMIPTTRAGAADNDIGDPIGAWLIEHAEEIGVQYVIWDRRDWRADRRAGRKSRYYGGEHPHHNHLHVELSPDGAAMKTPWFQQTPSLSTGGTTNPSMPSGPTGGGVAPEQVAACTVPSTGRVVDELDGCAELLGPAQYWRTAEDAGYGKHLRWTEAFSGDEPGNWARYLLDLDEPGRYKVELYGTPAYGFAERVRYTVEHASALDAVLVNQREASGWTTLGEYVFAAGGQQGVSVYDNVSGTVAAGQRVVFDAIRLTRCPDDGCSAPAPTPPTGPTDPVDPMTPAPPSTGTPSAPTEPAPAAVVDDDGERAPATGPGGTVRAGCTVATTPAGAAGNLLGAALVLLLSAVLRARRSPAVCRRSPTR